MWRHSSHKSVRCYRFWYKENKVLYGWQGGTEGLSRSGMFTVLYDVQDSEQCFRVILSSDLRTEPWDEYFSRQGMGGVHNEESYKLYRKWIG